MERINVMQPPFHFPGSATGVFIDTSSFNNACHCSAWLSCNNINCYTYTERVTLYIIMSYVLMSPYTYAHDIIQLYMQ